MGESYVICNNLVALPLLMISMLKTPPLLLNTGKFIPPPPVCMKGLTLQEYSRPTSEKQELLFPLHILL